MVGGAPGTSVLYKCERLEVGDSVSASSGHGPVTAE